MSTAMDLDAPAPPSGKRRSALAAMGLLAGVVIGVTATRASTAPPHLPVIRVEAAAEPPSLYLTTVVVSYRDGGRVDISSHVSEDWRPPRPVRLVTVVTGIECRVYADGALVAVDRAADYRLAVCAWAP